MNWASWVSTALSGFMLLGCASVDAAPATPALISSPDAKARAEIRETISRALNGTRVTIANDAFTVRSTLAIDPPGAHIGAASGRIMAKPDHFDMQMRGNKCELVHRQSGEIYALKHVRCKAV